MHQPDPSNPAPSQVSIPALPFPQNARGPVPAPISPQHEHPAGTRPDPRIPGVPAPAPLDLSALVHPLTLLLHHVEEMHHAIQGTRNTLAATHAADIEETLMLGATVSPLRVDYHGKRHVLIWTPATASITIQFDGIGAQTRALNAGWNVCDPPTGAKISATTSTTLRLRYTNDVPAGLA